MIYEFRDGKILTRALEYSVAYHCNLRCSGCSHMSPFLRPRLPTPESFEADLKAVSRIVHAADIRLVGGEPLLNPKINSFVRIAKESGIADQVMVTTNGLLLHRMDEEFWGHVDFISITLYPGCRPKEEHIRSFEERARQTNTRLRLFPSPVFRTTVVTEPHPKDWVTGMIYRTCKNAHLYHCHMIHEGKLYKCSVPPFLPEYLRRMDRSGYDPATDAFDINGASDMYRELRAFLESPRTMEACRYCLGYVGMFQDNHQLPPDVIRNPSRIPITRRSHLDRGKFSKEAVRYLGRRLSEMLTGGSRW